MPAYPRLGVAIETSFGAAVEQLLESVVVVYLSPSAQRQTLPRAPVQQRQQDLIDTTPGRWPMRCAWTGTPGARWPRKIPSSPSCDILCRDEVALIEERTALLNQLQQALHDYYPTALEAFDDTDQSGRLGLCRNLSQRRRLDPGRQAPVGTGAKRR